MSDLSKLKIGLILSIAVLCSGCVSQETPVYEGSVTADIYYVGSQFEDNLFYQVWRETSMKTRM